MGALQPMHLIIILAVVLLLFGPKKLPELAKGLGEGMKELRRTLHEPSPPEPVAGEESGRSAPDRVSRREGDEAAAV